MRQYTSLKRHINSLELGAQIAVQVMLEKLAHEIAQSPALDDTPPADLALLVYETARRELLKLHRDGSFQAYLEYARKERGHGNP